MRIETGSGDAGGCGVGPSGMPLKSIPGGNCNGKAWQRPLAEIYNSDAIDDAMICEPGRMSRAMTGSTTMMISRTRIAAIAIGAAVTLGTATPANAGTGCNGVVNWFVWGCAGWDNNNGPQFPYYRKRQVSVPAGTPAKIEKGVAYAQLNGQWSPMVAAGGGNIVAAGGGNIVAAGGGNVWVQQ